MSPSSRGSRIINHQIPFFLSDEVHIRSLLNDTSDENDVELSPLDCRLLLQRFRVELMPSHFVFPLIIYIEAAVLFVLAARTSLKHEATLPLTVIMVVTSLTATILRIYLAQKREELETQFELGDFEHRMTGLFSNNKLNWVFHCWLAMCRQCEKQLIERAHPPSSG